MKKTLTLMVGESATGKSTMARSMLDKQTVRVNRDSIRKMLFEKWNPKYEKLVEEIEIQSATLALQQGFNVIVDDLNINPKTRGWWKQYCAARMTEYKELEMTTSLTLCITRDRTRLGRDRVGQSVITKQFIRNGRPNVFENRPTVLVDIDGTVADCTGIRSPYDESDVYNDKVHKPIVDMVCNYSIGHQIIFVSGRHEDCGPDTEDWLNEVAEVPFEGLLMRNRGDGRDDVIVKQELLDLILKYVSKENIKLVIDDRPKVIRMWRENGLEVLAARGEDLEEF